MTKKPSRLSEKTVSNRESRVSQYHTMHTCTGTSSTTVLAPHSSLSSTSTSTPVLVPGNVQVLREFSYTIKTCSDRERGQSGSYLYQGVPGISFMPEYILRNFIMT